MNMSVVLALALVLSSGGALAAELQVIAGGGIAVPLNEIAAQFEQQSGHKITIRYGTAPELIVLAKTTPFDLALTPGEVFRDDGAMARLAPGGTTDIARVGLGVAVKAGAPKPDIASPEALKQALLGAKSVATIPASAAGAQVMKLFERLGVASEVKPKLLAAASPPKLIEALAQGQAELGLFLTNVLTTNGLDLVGPVPTELDQELVYTAAAAADAKQAALAREFLAFLR